MIYDKKQKKVYKIVVKLKTFHHHYLYFSLTKPIQNKKPWLNLKFYVVFPLDFYIKQCNFFSVFQFWEEVLKLEDTNVNANRALNIHSKIQSHTMMVNW